MKMRKGFTLIELMAVIAIILLLASIMIPNIMKNIERGKKAKAEADIDIFIKAISLYQIDNDGALPTDLAQLWESSSGGPYISSDQADTLGPAGSPYYKIDIGSDSGFYTITAYDKKGEGITSKKITLK